MALFPQFPYSNLHELNLDWLIEQIRQIEGEGVVLSVNGLTGVVTLYTDKDVVFPDLNFNDHWQIYREIDAKIAGLKFTGEKFFYITKNEGDEEFTVQEVYTSGNQPPYPVTSVNGQTGNVNIDVPVTSVNGRTGNVVLAGDNIPYNIDGSYTIEDVIIPLEKAIGHVIRYNTCSEGVTAGQYVYLIMSGISGRSDGLYKAVNAKSAGTVWTSADLAPVAGGLGALMASNDSAISQLNNKIEPASAYLSNIAYNLRGNALVYKSAEVKVLRLDFSSASEFSTPPQNQYVAVGTLPTGYYPNIDYSRVEKQFNPSSGALTAMYEILIKSTGEIQVYNYMTSKLSAEVVISYI